MVITLEGDRFVATTQYSDKDTVKAAGFRWDPTRRVWWTKFKENAARLVDYCDAVAKAALADHTAAVEASQATDAEIDVSAPAGLAYLPYQRAGIAYASARRGTLIADEMGLGKTIQALGVINATVACARILVVCPASLRLNWAREAGKWLVQQRPIVVVDNGQTIPNAGPVFVVTNYERLTKREDLRTESWDLVIVDEAHYAKNPKAARSKAIYETCTKAARTILLTGTPILNRPIELQPLLALLDSNTWGNFWAFAKRYCAAHKEQVARNKWVWNLTGASHLPELQERLRSTVMVRRLKADVLKELPAKRRTVIDLPIKHTDSDEAEMFQAQAETGHMPAFAEMSGYRADLGAKKVPAALDYIDTLREGGLNKVVVFAHHKAVIEAIASHYGAEAATVYGETSVDERQAAVDRFQTDDGCRVFVGSIKAAGVGLTLTAASTVVFVETDWVPGNMAQAEDRCHRIGQIGTVDVHVLSVPNTLDGYMNALVVCKAAVADSALDHDTKLTAPSGSADAAQIEAERAARYTVAADKRQAMLGVLRSLTAMCDGAVAIDASGFNKLDASFGHRLAECSDLTDKQYNAAHKMCRKYKRQIAPNVYMMLWS